MIQEFMRAGLVINQQTQHLACESVTDISCFGELDGEAVANVNSTYCKPVYGRSDFIILMIFS